MPILLEESPRPMPYSLLLDLCKPRIVIMVMVATAIGYALGGGAMSAQLIVPLLCGTALTCAGGAVLNNYLERDLDSAMQRTRGRALPCGALLPAAALALGIVLALSGVLILTAAVNLLTGFLALLTAFLYIVVYTPLKRITWLNTLVGAIPGAIPPLGGWTAATGSIDGPGWIVFAILYLWQLPHFYAIAWIHREDYARAGFKMLPALDPDGRRTMPQILVFSAILIPVSLLPAVIGLTGPVYLFGAFVAGMAFLSAGFFFAESRSLPDARGLLKASIFYLPVLLALVLADSVVASSALFR